MTRPVEPDRAGGRPTADRPTRRPTGSRRAVFYEVLVRSFRDSNGDGTGDFAGLIEKLDYLQWLGVDCLWLPPFFTSPLRDGGYDVADFTNILPEFGTVEDFHELPRRGPRARHPGDHRLRHEPHQRPAPVVPGQSRSDPDGPVRRLLRLVRHRRALPGRPDHLRRHRAVELDLGPGAPAVLLAPVLQPPARPQLRQPRGPRGDARGAARSGSTWASTASGSTPCPTSTSAPAPTARTSPRPTSSCKQGAASSSTTNYPGRVLLAEANQWPADVVDYFGDSERRRRRVPHGLPLPGDAAHLHGRPPRVALPDLGDPRADAGDPRRLPVGHLPAQPRRADPRDGHRRGPRLHVGASTPRTRG